MYHSKIINIYDNFKIREFFQNPNKIYYESFKIKKKNGPYERNIFSLL